MSAGSGSSQAVVVVLCADRKISEDANVSSQMDVEDFLKSSNVDTHSSKFSTSVEGST